jgi:hypothetical protein
VIKVTPHLCVNFVFHSRLSFFVDHIRSHQVLGHIKHIKKTFYFILLNLTKEIDGI